MMLSNQIKNKFRSAEASYIEFESDLRRNKRIIKDKKYNLELAKIITNYHSAWFAVCRSYYTKKPATPELEKHISKLIDKFLEIEGILKHLMFLARLTEC